MEGRLPPRYYGSIFYIGFSTSEKKSGPLTKGMIVPFPTGFFIFPINWAEPLYRVMISNITSYDKTESFIKLTFTTSKSLTTIFIREGKINKLALAIRPETPDRKLPPLLNTMDNIIPTFSFQRQQMNLFLTNIDSLFNDFFANFDCPKPYALTFSDLLIIFYRLRFVPYEKSSDKYKTEVMLKELCRQVAEEWVVAIAKAAVFDPEEHNSFEYSLRLVVNITDDLYKHKDFLDADIEPLLLAVAYMSERKDASKITDAAKAIIEKSRKQTADEYKEKPPVSTKYCRLIRRMLFIAFCGNIVQIFSIDIERITLKMIDLIMAYMNKAPTKQLVEELKVAVKSYGNEMLRFTNDKRYDPIFRYVFACKVVVDEILNMKL